MDMESKINRQSDTRQPPLARTWKLPSPRPDAHLRCCIPDCVIRFTGPADNLDALLRHLSTTHYHLFPNSVLKGLYSYYNARGKFNPDSISFEMTDTGVVYPSEDHSTRKEAHERAARDLRKAADMSTLSEEPVLRQQAFDEIPTTNPKKRKTNYTISEDLWGDAHMRKKLSILKSKDSPFSRPMSLKDSVAGDGKRRAALRRLL